MCAECVPHMMDPVVGKVDHIGIAVGNLEEAIARYSRLYELNGGSVNRFEGFDVRCAELQAGAVTLELVEATSDKSPVRRFLEKRGEGVHHICFAVDDLVDAIRVMEGKGIQMIDKSPRLGANGHLVACANPKDTGGILIELAEIG